MKKIIPPLCAFFLVLVALGCSRQERIYPVRLVDCLKTENVLFSPLQDYELDPRAFEREHPVIAGLADKFLLGDAGAGDNPFGIKKKIPLGVVEHNALLAPPKSHFVFPLDIPEGSFLEFTFGIRRDRRLDRNEKRNVRFIVTLRLEDETEGLLDKTLSLSGRQDLVFDYKKIDLAPYAGRSVNLHLLTKGDGNSLACWFNPVVYCAQESPRSVILISLDTLRPDHLGCYGYSRETSPAIDSLAEDSVLFKNCFASSPWTLPSHVSLLTALDCINHQVYQSDQKMDPALLTLADCLRTKGYLTAAFTGGGYVSAKYGFSKGFDSYHMRGRIQSSDSAEIISRAALSWIERQKDRNFFLFLHTYQVHNPYSSPPPFNRMFLEEDALYDRVDMVPLGFNHEKRFMPVSPELKKNFIGLYDAEIRYTDEAFIKPLVEKLRDLGLYDNSLIILTSDHGEEFFEHGAWLHTHSVYNEAIKIPLIIKYPGSKDAGRTVVNFARLTDIMPTILDELGIEYRDIYMDGRSLNALVRSRQDGEEEAERTFLAELAHNASGNSLPKKVAMNRGHRKLIIHEDFPPEFLEFFLYPPPSTPKIEAFDILKDPGELSDLSASSPELTRQLVEYVMAAYRAVRPASSRKFEVDAKIEEELRALGYIR